MILNTIRYSVHCRLYTTVYSIHKDMKSYDTGMYNKKLIPVLENALYSIEGIFEYWY